MAKDLLDKETSVSAEFTQKGVTAKSNSRAVNAFDRLLGNTADWLNVRLEADTTIKRAKTEGEKVLIEAAAKYGAKRIANDPDFAERAIANHLSGTYRKQGNKDAVVEQAIEDLASDPPTDEQSKSGDEKVDEAFMDRIEHYAEFASSDELRQRWGRVLAAEIRRPGTFSQKVLRVVDELDAETAKDFEALCQHRLSGVIPEVLCGELEHDVRTRLVVAGLLVEPGFAGKVVVVPKATLSNNKKVYFFDFGVNAPFAFADEATWTGESIMTRGEGETVRVKVYILTDAGEALATILPDQQRESNRQLALAYPSDHNSERCPELWSSRGRQLQKCRTTRLTNPLLPNG